MSLDSHTWMGNCFLVTYWLGLRSYKQGLNPFWFICFILVCEAHVITPGTTTPVRLTTAVRRVMWFSPSCQHFCCPKIHRHHLLLASFHKARWSQKDFEVSEQQDGCSWWCWNKESAQQVAEKGDLQNRVEAVARGPALGSAIPAEVGGGNELFRGSMWRAEEQRK